MPRTITVALAVLCLLISGCSTTPAAKGSGKRPASPVQVARAVLADVPLELRAIGNVEAWSSVAVKSRVAGQLDKVHVLDGADVNAGVLLFEIDPLPFIEAVRAAEAAVARDKAAEQQSVANIARARAQAENARAQARRYQRLFEEGVGSREQVDQMQSSADALDAQLNAERAALESARAALKADEARLAQSRLQLDYTKITAPISGRAGFINVRAGNLVKENDSIALVTLLQVTPVWVVFSVPEQTLPEVRRSMAAGPLSVQAVEEPSDHVTAEGRLDVIDNSVDTTTGTIRLKARFANADRRLWPGGFANVLLRLRTETGVLTIPASGVQSGPNGRFVWVVKPDSTAELRPVEISRTRDSVAIVTKGLAEGEQVVTSGQLRVAEGAPLRVLDGAKAR
ncbi:MAG: efflux RND transporter periplasmic adaptor subunit [Acidobacteria bacterium]|nr:efflux RND transporter periplasmic adaptor subunit [Acidobacteriota bacterium]